jgi:putative ABC transport system substrate-binding protein
MVTSLAAAVLLFTGPVAAPAQQTPRVYRIGFVSPTSSGPASDAFRQGLRDAGYVEGENVVIEARFAEGHQERLPELVREVLRLKVDVLVAAAGSAALAAKQTTTTVPIVFAGVSDPVALGLVASLARPGGNITGATAGVDGRIAGKLPGLLKDTVPHVSHVAVLWNSKSTNWSSAKESVKEIDAAARARTMKLDWFDAADAAELDRAFAAIATSRAQGIIVIADPFFFVNRVKLVRFAASKRLPAAYFFKAFADAGGLMSYGPSLEESFRRAARYVDKILKGAKPADLPIEQSTTFELAINLKTARTLGLTIPQSMLHRANHVID